MAVMPPESSSVHGLDSDSVEIRVPQDKISERRNILLSLREQGAGKSVKTAEAEEACCPEEKSSVDV